jgi:GR25 family glycosyltransferase involved in LPS biosynthesis
MSDSTFNISKYIDAVYFINLDRRIDRLIEIQNELAKMDISGIRFPAISYENGHIGCGYSHLEVLKIARERKLKNVLIFEDDFKFLVSKSQFQKEINDFFESKLDYDVLMLSYNIKCAEPFNSIVQRVYDAQTTSGYIVNSSFYDCLIDLYERHMPLLEQTGMHWIYAIDQIWKQFQGDVSGWYAFNIRIGCQRESYSDNERGYTNYGV